MFCELCGKEIMLGKFCSDCSKVMNNFTQGQNNRSGLFAYNRVSVSKELTINVMCELLGMATTQLTKYFFKKALKYSIENKVPQIGLGLYGGERENVTIRESKKEVI